MKRLLFLAARLYPRTWRQRYGAEFDALIEDDQHASLFDVLKGSLTMRLTYASPRVLIGGFALAGVLLAILAWTAIPNVYRSIGTVAVSKSLPDDVLLEASAKTLSETVLRDAMSKAGVVNLEVGQMRRMLSISNPTSMKLDQESKVFMVFFDSPDPNKAQVVTSFVLNRLAENLPQPLRIVDVPTIPKHPLSPYLTPMLVAGVFGGACCGLVFVGIARVLRRHQVA